ncbi:hypothetical protein Sjap_003019 [Stephania japonica]|uniref:Uncharacterized protein n=1 Tax=Stephania japonica TaxID=461633 RepID=A0AAP0KPQ1_9MAGN
MENQITGILPSSIGNLKNLKSLVVLNNRINGTIPRGIGELSQLIYLDLSSNFFEVGTKCRSYSTLAVESHYVLSHIVGAPILDHQDDKPSIRIWIRAWPSIDIGQGSRVQISIGHGRGRGRFQSMQHQPRQEDHIPSAPPERGLTLSQPPPPSVIRRPAIRPAPFEPPSRPTSRPRSIEGTLDLRRDALSPPTEQLISTGLAELASMTRQSQNSTPSSSTHHSTPSSYAGGRSAGATYDSPSSSTHPSTSSSAPRQLPHVEMPHDSASPSELTGERDEPRIRITVKNKRYVVVFHFFK